jgi:glycogen synthase
MQVLAVTPEIFPLVKTGGLADVTGALPLALAGQGVAVRTLVPGYPQVLKALGKGRSNGTPVHRYTALQGGDATVVSASVAGLDLLVLDAPHLFDRIGGPYGDTAGIDWPDNWRRFAALGFVGADIAAGGIGGYRPDLVHAHDWQAALTLAYMRYGAAAGTPSVMTVHNLAFQGRFAAGIFGELGLPGAAMSRIAGGMGDHNGEPDLCAGDTHAGIRHGARRADLAARGRPDGHRQRHRRRHMGPAEGQPSRGHLHGAHAEEPRRQPQGGRAALFARA